MTFSQDEAYCLARHLLEWEMICYASTLNRMVLKGTLSDEEREQILIEELKNIAPKMRHFEYGLDRVIACFGGCEIVERCRVLHNAAEHRKKKEPIPTSYDVFDNLVVRLISQTGVQIREEVAK